ncbi:hypothetical protein, variant 1 [Cryptococcus amylolentus CBS 6039]|uniref:DUF676 domain-containing protein n=3 Tax=Cryptococcus amylolentus CBS 6039 TaxID=1295533 RepID=A0A1E3HMV8_9TREE|nr:hypothetical protein, variant 1 [Cryptococcus amylolentus CBS 6039]ODN77056.1 hypothetical protein, variant 1 [Cryptococcus amylolentus CBS 6039]
MRPVHLIILIHGLYGDIHNLHAVKGELLALAEPQSSNATSQDSEEGLDEAGSGKAQDGLETVVYLPKTIPGAKTWDGIDVCAARVADEIDQEIERLQDEDKDVVGFSVMGYSLGGLISRYLIGLLHARQPSFFARHKPVSFSTAATPHLGVLKYGTTTNTVVHTIGRRLFSQTGKQLYNLDREPEWAGRSLLEVMSDPDNIFIQALKLFPKSMIVANGTQDLTVPYPTATFSLTDPFADPTSIDVEVNDQHIVQSYRPLSPASLDRPSSRSSLLTSRSNRRMKDGSESADEEDVEISITSLRSKGDERKRPVLPPFLILPLRWPFNYSLVLFVPFLLPILLLYISITVIIHTFHSRRRIQSHRNEYERQPLLSASTSTIDLSSLSASEQAETATTAVQINPSDGICTPPMADPLPASAAEPLLLTPQQKLMIRNLNAAIPNAERVVAWFPWAFNAHAMLICRTVARFSWQEDGRGAVRAWTKFVFQAGETECHARGTGAVAHGST